MVYKLSQDEVMKVCGNCKQYVKDNNSCRTEASGEVKTLKELHRCKKWDEFFGSTCIYQG